jgi:glutamate 5-kinase
VDCLYDKNPRSHPDAKAIEVVEDISMLEADGTSPLFSHSPVTY